MFFVIPVTGDKFPVTRNKFPLTGNKFPVKGNKFPVTGNKFPVTRRTKNTLCHRNNISLRWKYTSCDRLNSFYTPVKEIQIFYIFPVTRKFLPVRRIIFPLTARTTD